MSGCDVDEEKVEEKKHLYRINELRPYDVFILSFYS